MQVELVRLEREIWEVAHVTEEDFETNEGDLYDELIEMTGWKVTDNENENVLSCCCFYDKYLMSNVTLLFLIKVNFFLMT